MAKTAEPTPAQLLVQNRLRAQRMAQELGVAKVRRLLQRAELDLRRMLTDQGPRLGEDSFTVTRLRLTLGQVRDVVASLKKGMKGQLVDASRQIAERESNELLEYLQRAEKQFRGINQVLGLDHARIVDRAVAGAESSVLHRIASDPNHPGNPGVLDRYGDNVIRNFEEVLQTRLVTRAPWADVRQQLIDQSPFLRGKPMYWAERIARTEAMNANGRAGWETIREAHAELGDMCKIVSSTFDGRTGADSVAVHGQIRRPEEAFESWNGMFQHPPDRPNDRAAVVPHRVSWPIPAALMPRGDGEVMAAWTREGRKGSPPGRPKMSTIDRKLFGKEPKEEPQEQESPLVGQMAKPDQPGPNVPSMPWPKPQPPQPPPVVLPRPRRPSDRQLRMQGLQRLRELPVHNDRLDVVGMREPPDDLTDGTRARIEAAAIAEVARDPRERQPLRQVRIEQVHSLPWTVPFQQARNRILTAGSELRQNNGPVVVRQGGNLYAATEGAAAHLMGRHLEGRTMARVHIVDLDKPPPAPPQPVASPSGQRTKTAPVHVDFVSPADFVKNTKSRYGYVEERHLKTVFGDNVPTKESLERTWGSTETGMTVELHTMRTSAGYGQTEFSVSGKLMKEGREIGSITRSFHKHAATGVLEVHHDFFVINSNKDRSGGSAEAMLRQSIQSYDKMKVDEVTVDAAWVGQYAWATFGYQWSESEARTRERELTAHMTRHGVESRRAATIAKQVAPYPWDVAAVDVDGIRVQTRYNAGGDEGTKEGSFTLGKSFQLTQGMWSGKIEISNKNSPSYQRAKQRLGL